MNQVSYDIGNELHLECLWFCFSSILQRDVNGLVEHWNTHQIRLSRHGTVPGVPNVLYFSDMNIPQPDNNKT